MSDYVHLTPFSFSLFAFLLFVQLWNGNEHWYQKGFHGIQELFYWQTRNTQLDSVTRKAYNWFKSGYLPGGNLFSL